MSLTNPPTGASAPGSVSGLAGRGPALKRSVQAAFEGTYISDPSITFLLSYFYSFSLFFLLSLLLDLPIIIKSVRMCCASIFNTPRPSFCLVSVPVVPFLAPAPALLCSGSSPAVHLSPPPLLLLQFPAGVWSLVDSHIPYLT